MTLPDQHDEPHAPALDHAGGIARLMGDAALFARVLVRFRNDYRHTAAAIRNALARGDTALALRLVHTLKGAAGIIEAVPLSRAAQALEEVLRSGAGDAGLHQARLAQALDRVLLELDAAAALPAAVQACTAPASPGASIEQEDIVRRLARLLDEGNGEAVDLVREATAALTARLGEQRYRRLADTIEAFDFNGALALLAASA